jgi:hypothetical protein
MTPRTAINGLLAALALACAACGPARRSTDHPRPEPPPRTPTPACQASDRPQWVCERPATTAEWRYGVGWGPDRDAAYERAVMALAQGIGIESTGITEASLSELVDGEHVELREEYRRTNVAAWKQTIRDLVELPPDWQAPDGDWWVRVRAPAKHILTRRVEVAAVELADALPAGSRVLVLPGFELTGITHSLGVVLADRISAGLLARGAKVSTVRRPRAAGGLDALLKETGADVVVYATIYGDREPIAVMFEAVRPPELSRQLALVPMDLPADAYIEALRMAHPTPVPDFLKAKVMGLGQGPVAIEVEVEPAAPVEGQPVLIRVRSPIAGYLTILNVGTDGGVTRVVPRRADEPTPIAAGQWFEIPGDVIGLEGETLLATMPPFPGPERMIVIVTEQAGLPPADRFPDAVSGAATERHAHAELLRALWSLEDAGSRWGARAMTFVVRPR